MLLLLAPDEMGGQSGWVKARQTLVLWSPECRAKQTSNSLDEPCYLQWAGDDGRTPDDVVTELARRSIPLTGENVLAAHNGDLGPALE